VAHRAGTVVLARKLGKRIRTLREAAGITQEHLAWDCDLAKAHLSQIEAGRGLPSVPVICALAKRLKRHPLELLAFDPDDPLVQLVDAARRHHRAGVLAALKALARE
jgi:transcriptional regulator with XRE-family HTH domain